MMFGHQDQDAPPDAQNGPAPDGTLDNNNVTATTNDDANQDQGGVMQSDDNNGGYMTDGDGAPAPTTGTDTSTNDVPTSAPATTSDAPASDDLLDIKQQALQQLSPLLGHLDQSPEEKFRTTMMLIQASDNDSLIKTAYDAAGQISDEKDRAQALLDVINEINYFTHQSDQSDQNAA
jgi:hypothetical protein